jgi:hypothetical protein
MPRYSGSVFLYWRSCGISQTGRRRRQIEYPGMSPELCPVSMEPRSPDSTLFA